MLRSKKLCVLGRVGEVTFESNLDTSYTPLVTASSVTFEVHGYLRGGDMLFNRKFAENLSKYVLFRVSEGCSVSSKVTFPNPGIRQVLLTTARNRFSNKTLALYDNLNLFKLYLTL